MQFRVVIPEHVKSGQTIRIHCPDGTEANVKVPKGLKAGDSFIFEMSVDQLNNPQALLDSLKEKTSNNATLFKANKKKGFLDREIVNLQDFFLALTVGLIIGMGIVLGFLTGILFVTKNVAQLNTPAQQPAPQGPMRPDQIKVIQDAIQKSGDAIRESREAMKAPNDFIKNLKTTITLQSSNKNGDQ